MIGTTVASILHAIGLVARPNMAKPNALVLVGALATYRRALVLCGVFLSAALLQS